jgi:hypothetical protein
MKIERYYPGAPRAAADIAMLGDVLHECAHAGRV